MSPSDTPFSRTEPDPLSRAAPTAVDGPTDADAPSATGAWSGTFVPEDGEDDLVGETLCNTYIIERVLGEGGMGRVYLARHTRIRRKRFAIKTLHPEYLRRQDLVTRFQREAEAAAAIQNEHVVGVYDVDKTPDGRPFLVAELLSGKELGDLLDEQGKLTVPYTARIARQLCKALSAAHAQGVIHRDVKPENVFLTGDLSRPHLKVIDFGISRLDEGGDEAGAGLTKTGMIMGTPAYMPPEQARGERVDARADIYAVGAIIYRALTGKTPFERSEPSAIVLAVLTQEPPRPRTHEPNIPEHLEAIIQRAMAKIPAERFQTMDELHDALALYDTSAAEAATATTLGGAGPGRAQTLTHSTLAQEAREVRDARPQFVLLLVVASFALVAGLFTAISAAVFSLRGSGLTATELLVGAITAVALLATPTVLALRHLRRNAWDNSLRMLELVAGLRRPLVAGVTVYGLAWLLVALIDHALLERLVRWPGWDAWLFLLALAAALLIWRLQGKRAAGATSDGREVAAALSSPVAAIPIAAIAVAAVVLLSLTLRDAPSTSYPAPGAGVTGAPGAVAGPPGSPPKVEQAPEAELKQAQADGPEALATLARQYPSDARVLRELVVARGATADGLAAALDAAEQLHQRAPKMLLDEAVQSVIMRAAASAGELSDRALEMLAVRMGERGPDRLYEISRSSGGARSKATKLLAREDVQGRASPALRVALALQQAQGCSAKAALLDRAAADGDERSARVLEPLTVGRKSGCGFLNLSSCPARCTSQAGRMRQTVSAIRARKKGGG